MISFEDENMLRRHKANVAVKMEALEKARLARDEHIRALLTRGVTPTQIGRVTRLSRTHIYQIKRAG